MVIADRIKSFFDCLDANRLFCTEVAKRPLMQVLLTKVVQILNQPLVPTPLSVLTWHSLIIALQLPHEKTTSKTFLVYPRPSRLVQPSWLLYCLWQEMEDDA